MSGTELPNVITKVSTAQLLASLSHAWPHLFNGALPKRASLDVLGAQWALETGWGRSMHCYNIGNVKGKVGGDRDYCFFACNEILTSASARHLAALDPEHAKITADNGKNATIWFYPKHSGCCFRAFKTLDEGAADYLSLLFHRFGGAWPSVLAGEPEAFALKLHDLHYYTASVGLYTSALKRCYTTVAGVRVDLQVAPPPFDPQKLKAMFNANAADHGEMFSLPPEAEELENDAAKADAIKDV